MIAAMVCLIAALIIPCSPVIIFLWEQHKQINAERKQRQKDMKSKAMIDKCWSAPRQSFDEYKASRG